MTADELGSEPADQAGQRSEPKRVADTVRFLVSLGVMVVGLSLLFTLELFVRL